MTRTARAVLAAFSVALTACETPSDVVTLGNGSPDSGDDGFRGGAPSLPPPDGSGGTGGSGATAAGTGGGIMMFPPSSGGGSGCASVRRIEEKASLNVHVLLDQSWSMMDPLPAPATGLLGQAVREAFARFVADPALSGHSVGLQFFPQGASSASCTADYETPAVPIAAMSANAEPLLAALKGRTVRGGWPLGPALAGAVAQASLSPPALSIVLLVTTGLPSECEPSDVAGVAAIAEAAYDSPSAVRTQVVGLNLGTRGRALDAIAAAGGTSKATLVEAGANVVDELYQAMRSVLQARPCKWAREDPPSGASAALDKTFIEFVAPQSTQKQSIGFVGSPDRCQGDAEPGWYLEGPPGGQDVVLCPRSCTEVQGADEVTTVFGCKGPTS